MRWWVYKMNESSHFHNSDLVSSERKCPEHYHKTQERSSFSYYRKESPRETPCNTFKYSVPRIVLPWLCILKQHKQTTQCLLVVTLYLLIVLQIAEVKFVRMGAHWIQTPASAHVPDHTTQRIHAHVSLSLIVCANNSINLLTLYRQTPAL